MNKNIDLNSITQEITKARNKAFRKIRKCLYKNCENNAIKSHVLQKNGILREIAKDNHIIQFSFSQPFDIERHGLYSFESVGINVVYTFSGFCNNHDTKLFEPIEKKRNFDLYSIESQYLFSYRTLCQEIRKKEVVLDIFTSLIGLSLADEPDMLIELKNNLENLEDGLKNLHFFKSEFEIDIETKAFSRFNFETLEIPKIEICISGALGIEDASNPQSVMYDILPFATSIINVFPINKYSYVIAGYHNEYKDYWLADLMLRIKGAEKTTVFKELSDLVSTRIELWCMSPHLFERLPKEKTECLKKLWNKEVFNCSFEINVDFNLFA